MDSSELRAELERRAALDQEARSAVAGWSDDPQTELWDVVKEVDTDNTRWLLEVVTEQGWPRMSEIGEEAATNAWLLAQHADLQLEHQRTFHQRMKEAVAAGEATSELFAYLDDRVRTNAGKAQLYGTQFIDRGQGLEVQPIEDPDGLAARRAAMGMEPFEENEARMHEIWKHDGASDTAGRDGDPD
ncbi:hypothetical protein OG394_29190 [Kribbella sp. NBC_01245]|uniref:DUF6624 domain-containing protein n=1 Tax=Kribbella sp. NBC_01245 TaxID=2903578 RepID=UPI002E296A0F|nr:DUF6624 domain-containing protein [Kribbella sp. NBC_01245]